MAGSLYRMRAGRWATHPQILRDRAVEGILRASDLEELGVPRDSTYRRCRDNGPWRRLLPGIIMLSNGNPTPTQQLVAALTYAGPNSMITGLRACELYGIRRGPRRDSAVHLLVPHGRQLRSSEFVTIERTRYLPNPVLIGELPVAPSVRACLDAARRLWDRHEITELLADAVQRKLAHPASLARELDLGSQRGSATPRTVIIEMSSGVRSAAELDAKALWKKSGLAEPWWNASVYNQRHELLGVVDGWFDDVALAWEIDSVGYHLAPEDYSRTVRRAARLTAEGIIILPSLPKQLRDDKETVLRELTEAHRVAAARPRPPLHAVPSSVAIPAPRQSKDLVGK